MLEESPCSHIAEMHVVFVLEEKIILGIIFLVITAFKILKTLVHEV